jgi:protease IV
MKQFFGAFLGSIVGVIAATLIAVLIVGMIITASVGSALKSERQTLVKDNSIIKIALEGRIVDREKSNPLKDLKDVSPFNLEESTGLNVLLAKIRQAADDSRIKGIYLALGELKTGMASLQELRNALLQFRKKGKFIFAYAENYSESEYYLASAADRVFVNPQGMMEWKGLSMKLMFFRKTLEKLDIDVEVYRHGKYKSAVEPFIADRMSASNRAQSESFLNSIWSAMLTDVSGSRRISTDSLQAIANHLDMQFPEKLEGVLVDKAAYEDEVIRELKLRNGMKETDKLKFTDIGRYPLKPHTELKAGSPRIAVIYAAGAISSGEGSDDEVGSDELARTIREARNDTRVKAIVLRVNSPGGSAIASDVIWREVYITRKSKPVVVSMGDLAASGGYYISCAADRIFAQKNTITGSIGVFGILPNVGRMLENKFGITTDTVNTNRSSDVGSGLRGSSREEAAYIQQSVEKVYTTFISRVAEGRKMPVELVDSIGQGRVWSGSEALEHKLIDEFGGLSDAISYAAGKAGIKDYRTVELPRQRSPLESLLGHTESDLEERIAGAKLGAAYKYFAHLKSLLSLKGVQTRLPFEFILE